jgi:histone acetyltransferase
MHFVFQLNSIFVKKVDIKYKTWKFRNLIALTSKCVYIIRWWFLKIEETKKKIFFEVIKNNGFAKNLKILLQLKILFSKQLPNMPIFYINQIILDIRQESIVLIKYENFKSRIIGGCSYRFFKRQQILELIFFSIATSEQMKGYGKLLMSFLKEKAKSNNVKTIITCADNNAIKYFLKQGFSQVISSPIFIWAGYLSDYEDIKLMECLLLKRYKYYNDIPFMLNFKFLISYKSRLIRKNNNNYNLLKIFKNYANCFKFKLLNFFFRISKKLKKFTNLQFLNSILTSIKIKQMIIPFLEPVDSKKSGARDYFKIIFHAVDLRTIEERLRIKSYYLNFLNFQKDILQLIQNCVLYNGKFHFITEDCLNIQKILINFKL